MGFNIHNNYGPNIDVHDGGVVNLRQDGSGKWHTADDVVDAEVVVEISDATERIPDEKQGKEETAKGLNYFAPTKRLQEFLQGNWFKEFRTDDRYNEQWTDAFISALMESQWKDGIAKDWAVGGERQKKVLIKGCIVGILIDAGVLKNCKPDIAKRINIMEKPRTFSAYISRGKKQPYADWVKSYVEETSKK